MNVAILFGGQSPEHEVSVITGLQVLEQIDRKHFTVFAVFQDQQGVFWYYPHLENRKQFRKIKPQRVIFGKDEKGGFFKIDSFNGKKHYLEAAYLAYHGGTGESGVVQGMLQNCGIGYTSSSVEGSAVSMNKVLTKELLEKNGINTIPWVRQWSRDIIENVDLSIKEILKKLEFPVIVKPTHLGSSIGVKVAKTSVELKKALLESAQVDNEILIEKFVDDFKEYNCSVREVNGVLQSSEVEEPVSQDEILSFADKYERGGGKKSGGMASLSRKLPADISKDLTEEIQDLAQQIFVVSRCKGFVRIDFMYVNKKLYPIEINPIPGSVAFYLWEASGISFTQQISDSLNEAIAYQKKINGYSLSYSTNIVDKFTSSN